MVAVCEGRGVVMSFYGGTYIDYCEYCDDRYSGKFKLKKNENVFDGFERWLKEHGLEAEG